MAQGSSPRVKDARGVRRYWCPSYRCCHGWRPGPVARASARNQLTIAFAILPVPTSADMRAILDRIVRRIARRLADEAGDDGDVDAAPDVLAQVQAEAVVTWRSPLDAKPTVRGVETPACVVCRQSFVEAGIELVYHDYAGYPEYPQPHLLFDHFVTILDRLACVGRDAPKCIWGWRS
jgi:WbqC-like protein